MTESSARVVIQSQVKNYFSMFDTEGKGYIQIKFFGTLMRSLGFNISEEVAHSIAGKIDTEKSEVISFDQFRKYFWNIINSQETKKDFQMAFNIMDVDRDGFVSYEDLKIFLQSLGEQRSSQQIKQMMQDADVDGDEHISYEEFIRLMITR